MEEITAIMKGLREYIFKGKASFAAAIAAVQTVQNLLKKSPFIPLFERGKEGDLELLSKSQAAIALTRRLPVRRSSLPAGRQGSGGKPAAANGELE